MSYLINESFSRTIAMISVPCTVLGSMLARRLLRIGLHLSWLEGNQHALQEGA